ncbi:MAG: hypothetical protein R3B47_04405 [Bacteroidia bacterium]
MSSSSAIPCIDMVIGAKGSRFRLSCRLYIKSIIRLEIFPRKRPNNFAKHPLVESSIQMAYGDNFSGHRIVGTEHSYVDHYKGKLAEGRLWEKTLEATIGSSVAKKTGLKVGDTFFSAHGLEGDDDVHTNATLRWWGFWSKALP